MNGNPPGTFLCFVINESPCRIYFQFIKDYARCTICKINNVKYEFIGIGCERGLWVYYSIRFRKQYLIHIFS